MSNSREKKTYTKLLGLILSRYCGHGNAMRYEDVAERAGCSNTLVRQLANGEGAVGFDLAMDIVQALPDEAATEFFAGLGFRGLARIEDASGSLHETHYHLTRALAYYGEAYSDGLLDHVEQRNLITRFLPPVLAAAARCVRAGR